MKAITDYLKYIPPSSDPLSADVYIIGGKENVYIVDVGNDEESLRAISSIAKDKVVILSHCHEDHVGNIGKLDYKGLYVGGLTYEKIGKGAIIENELIIEDGVRIEIKRCPSPHTDGSLIVTVDRAYTLLADLYFTRPAYDKALAYKMLEVLKTIETEYFVVSHQEAENVFGKDFLIKELYEYFK